MISKSSQLQIRISSSDKALLQSLAKEDGKDLSSWILEKILPSESQTFQTLISKWKDSGFGTIELAEINSFLTSTKSSRFKSAVEIGPREKLPLEELNYLAAMVEMASNKKGLEAPSWVSSVEPLTKPLFGSELKSLRLHLLTKSPPPFRKRNIFIDSAIGDQV